MLDVYGAREEPIAGVSGRLITERLEELPGDRVVAFLPGIHGAADAIAHQLREGDVLFTVGAGDITTVGPQVLALLADRPA